MSLADGISFQAASAGTGTFVFGSARASFLTLAQGVSTGELTDGQTVSYLAQDSLSSPTQREWGHGTFSAGGNSIARTTVLVTVNGNSVATGTPFNFPAAPFVSLTVLAEDISAGGSPGGSNTQLQYNNSGTFGGIATATWDGLNLTLDGGNQSGSPGGVINISGGNDTTGISGGGAVTIAGGIDQGPAINGQIIVNPNVNGAGGSVEISGGAGAVAQLGAAGGEVRMSGGGGTGVAGGAATLEAGNSDTADGGGSLQNSGNSTSGNGGQALVNAGNSVTGQGGNASMFAGNSLGGSNDGGAIEINSGTSFGGTGGPTNISAADGITGGELNFDAGNSAAGAGGGIFGFAGNGTTTGGVIEFGGGQGESGAGGDVILFSGDSVSGRGGNVTIDAGAGTPNGNIILSTLPTSDPSITGAVWNHGDHLVLSGVAVGVSATITTAKITPTGASGSMTFTNGILTAQTPAT